MSEQNVEIRLALLESAMRLMIGFVSTNDRAIHAVFAAFPDHMARVYGTAGHEPKLVHRLAENLTGLIAPSDS